MIPINFFPSFALSFAESKPQIGKPLMSKNGLIDSSINRLSRPGRAPLICSYHCIYVEIYGYLIIIRRGWKGTQVVGGKCIGH